MYAREVTRLFHPSKLLVIGLEVQSSQIKSDKFLCVCSNVASYSVDRECPTVDLSNASVKLINHASTIQIWD